MLPGDFDYAELIGQCHDFAEMTGTDARDFSLVERAVLRGLGVDRLDFVPAAPAAAEDARLAAAKRAT